MPSGSLKVSNLKFKLWVLLKVCGFRLFVLYLRCLILNQVFMDYENRNIPDVASAVKHLGAITGVECHINEVPFLKEKGLFSLPTVSEDVVRIASKYGFHEFVTGDVYAFRQQFIRVIRALSQKGVFPESEFDRFFE